MKLLTVIGARPQFVKAAVISKAINEKNIILSNNKVEEIIVHTGQHFDNDMSESFFNDLAIPNPKHHLGLGNLSHGAMTGRMIEAIESVLISESPDCVIVIGDTNSTLAAAISASKLQIPIAHIEAGLRSHNLLMPEEINRILTDRVSTFLFCPSDKAIANLKAEGYPLPIYHTKQSIFNYGDVMYDVLNLYKEQALRSYPVSRWGLNENEYALVTLHRPHLTDSKDNLCLAFESLKEISKNFPVVIPLHPRANAMLKRFDLEDLLEGLIVLNPVSYLQIQSLLANCKIVLTDSGGLQKEALWHMKPCLTLRNDTEWTETIDSGWNKLVGIDKDLIIQSCQNISIPESNDISMYGNGSASNLIINELIDNLIN